MLRPPWPTRRSPAKTISPGGTGNCVQPAERGHLRGSARNFANVGPAAGADRSCRSLHEPIRPAALRHQPQNPNELSPRPSATGLTQFVPAVARPAPSKLRSLSISVTANLPLANVTRRRSTLPSAMATTRPRSSEALGSAVNPPTYTSANCPQYPGETNPYCGASEAAPTPTPRRPVTAGTFPGPAPDDQPRRAPPCGLQLASQLPGAAPTSDVVASASNPSAAAGVALRARRPRNVWRRSEPSPTACSTVGQPLGRTRAAGVATIACSLFPLLASMAGQ